MNLKFIQSLVLIAGMAFSAYAADGHDHSHGKVGPTGGKLIAGIEPHAEFFVNADKKVEIRFVDDENKVVAPQEQIVTAIMGDRSSPTRLKFTKDGDKLISDQPIPAGDDFPTVLQVKTNESAKTVTEKFNLKLAKCPTCKNPEYACTCEHGKEAEHNHDDNHKDGDAHDHKH